MDIQRARLYAWVSFGVSLLLLLLTFIFVITVSYQARRDGNGRGLYVLSQFLSSPMKGTSLAIASPFDKGSQFYNSDSDRKLIEEMLVRYYLEMRYSFIPDDIEMVRRWDWTGPLARISSFALHQKVVGKSKLKERIKKMPRDVKTVNISEIFPDEKILNQYNVRMQINTITENGEFKSDDYNVMISFRYSNSYRTFFREPVNPYGLYFNEISIKKRTSD